MTQFFRNFTLFLPVFFLPVFFLPVFFLPVFVAVSGAGAASSPTETSFGERDPESYLDYQPRAEDFPQQLSRVVQMVAAAKYIDAIRTMASNEYPRGLRDEVFFLTGLSHEKLGEHEKAQKAFKQSLDERESNPLVHFHHALMLKEGKKYEQSIAEFQEVRWMTKSLEHEVLHQLAECQTLAGRPEAAGPLLERAQNLNPNYLPVARALMANRVQGLNLQSGKRNAALENRLIQDLPVLMKADPEDKKSKVLYARLLFRRSDALLGDEDLKQAEQIARKVADESDYRNVDAVRLLFDIQLKRGQRDEAERTVTRGIQKTPDAKLLLDGARQLEIEKEGSERESAEKELKKKEEGSSLFGF